MAISIGYNVTPSCCTANTTLALGLELYQPEPQAHFLPEMGLVQKRYDTSTSIRLGHVTVNSNQFSLSSGLVLTACACTTISQEVGTSDYIVELG